MTFNIITIFPDILNSYLNESIVKRAIKNKIIKINTINLRDFASDKHNTVDDRPYGGGAGMVLMAEPICKALHKLQSRRGGTSSKLPALGSKIKGHLPAGKAGRSKVILLSAKGKKWDQQLAKRYAKLNSITFICGHYEGVDERVKKLINAEVSIGDYVLTGGELAAMVMIDSITRLLPGALGNKNSIIEESHSVVGELEYPHYTRPEVLKIKGKNCKVPKILLSGNHKKIEEWRKSRSKKLKVRSKK
ncbi:MAG: tRNA (guanosine(37)-N1)-methyltransferase TrmD [bacterium]|nr:tRNA (guanosine(37)-N1)-methyltransferase TrmD [bacterium]